jgi:DNA polymerase/3'-5' exonuclease PolX
VSDKPKFPRAQAIEVAKELCDLLRPCCERLVVAGSLRRRKTMVGDIEILFVPLLDHEPDGLFETKLVSRVDTELDKLLRAGALTKRLNVNGSATWGEKNKLAVHYSTGIPVDFFGTSMAAWYNYLVCRTGPADSNTRIATAALAKGWKWNPYGEGFSNGRGEQWPVDSEQAVFRFVGLKYLEPWER